MESVRTMSALATVRLPRLLLYSMRAPCATISCTAQGVFRQRGVHPTRTAVAETLNRTAGLLSSESWLPPAPSYASHGCGRGCATGPQAPPPRARATPRTFRHRTFRRCPWHVSRLSMLLEISLRMLRAAGQTPRGKPQWTRFGLAGVTCVACTCRGVLLHTCCAAVLLGTMYNVRVRLS